MAIIITELGVGYEECVYREALKLELKNLDVKFECGVSVPIVYKSVVIGDSQEIGKVEIDFVIARDRGAHTGEAGVAIVAVLEVYEKRCRYSRIEQIAILAC